MAPPEEDETQIMEGEAPGPAGAALPRPQTQPAGGGLRVHNRQVLADIKQIAGPDEDEQRQQPEGDIMGMGDIMMRHHHHRGLARPGTAPTGQQLQSLSKSGSHHSLLSRGLGGPLDGGASAGIMGGGLLRGGKSTKAVESAVGKMAEQRKTDQKHLREKAERLKLVREQRFERLLEDLLSQDELKCNVSSMIRHQSMSEFKKHANMYGEWNDKIFGNLQGQVGRHLNPPDRSLKASFQGSKSVDFQLPGQEFRGKVSLKADPAKQQLNKRAEEESFRRTAENVFRASRVHTNPFTRSSVGFDPLALDPEPELDPDPRAMSRPVLDPVEWSQVRLQDTPYGFFAQATEASASGIMKKQLKQGPGVFIPSEKDGVPASGKRRTRFERNNLGVLQGEFAQRGETIQFKQKAGGGSGAPAQDHYLFEKGVRVTDYEFPLGKKIFKHMH